MPTPTSSSRSSGDHPPIDRARGRPTESTDRTVGLARGSPACEDEQLMNEEHWLLEVVEAMPDGVVIVNAGGEIMLVNR